MTTYGFHRKISQDDDDVCEFDEGLSDSPHPTETLRSGRDAQTSRLSLTDMQVKLPAVIHIYCRVYFKCARGSFK